MKKFLAIVFAAILAVSALTLAACGSKGNDAPAETKITIAASPTPHADILEIAKGILAKKGITLEIQEYNDYVVPNNVVESGEVDANYFQHVPYLDDFNKENGTHIIPVLEVHHEPMGVYSNTYDSFDVITGGASEPGKTFKIGIPNDPTNEARALALLQVLGLITLKDTGDVEATVMDIIDNPYGIEFREIEAAQLPNVLQDLDFAVINSNYAIDAGLTPFVTEGPDVSYPNIIAVKEGNENSDKIKALVAAVNSQEVVDYINSKYKGAIVCDLVSPTPDGLDSTVDYDALSGAQK